LVLLINDYILSLEEPFQCEFKKYK